MAYTDDWESLMNGVFGAGGKLKFGGAQPQPEKPAGSGLPEERLDEDVSWSKTCRSGCDPENLCPRPAGDGGFRQPHPVGQRISA